MSDNNIQTASFSDLVSLAELRLDEVKNIQPLLDEIYKNRYLLKSFGLDIFYKGKSITELYSLDYRNKNQ